MMFMQNEGHWPTKAEEDLILVLKDQLKLNEALSKVIDMTDDMIKELVKSRVRNDSEFWSSIFNK